MVACLGEGEEVHHMGAIGAVVGGTVKTEIFVRVVHDQPGPSLAACCAQCLHCLLREEHPCEGFKAMVQLTRHKQPAG